MTTESGRESFFRSSPSLYIAWTRLFFSLIRRRFNLTESDFSRVRSVIAYKEALIGTRKIQFIVYTSVCSLAMKRIFNIGVRVY